MPRVKKTNTTNREAPIKTSSKKGVKSAPAQTGAMNPIRTKIAKRIEKMALSGGQMKSAGMMLDSTPMTSGGYSANSLSAYYTSYANGMNDFGGTRDIPPYFTMMNEQNGGMLYWPVTLREKYEFYRYFTRTDAYCGRGIELLTDLPMSKLALNMPKMEGQPEELKKEIKSFYEAMCDKLNLFDKLRSMLWEYHTIGNCFIFHEWDEKKKSWEKISILPPEEVRIFYLPFSDIARIEYRPERLVGMIKSSMGGGDHYQEGTAQGDILEEIMNTTPDDIIKMIQEKDCIVMDTDPTEGSFCFHLARNRSPYQDLGVSVLERVFVPMLTKEHYRYTQLGLASRNMTPKNKISAPGLLPDELTDLRAQVDLSYLDPEFSIVTNYDWDWQQIGAEGRLLDLAAENEAIENQIFAGLGVTRELLTGEGMYSGTKITVEILNTLFLLTREILQNYVEKQLFRPVAEAHKWYKEDANGVKEYFYPKLRFNRLSIRDNQEVFDSMFQMYQKGSLPVDIIYELLNLNADDIHDKIYSDLFTVKDAVFNRVIEEASSEVGRALVDKTDLLKRTAKYLRLHNVDEQGTPLQDDIPDNMILTPDEMMQKQRALKKEKIKMEMPEMAEFNPQDVEEIADEIAKNVDVNQNPEVLKQTISQTVDEVLGNEKQN